MPHHATKRKLAGLTALLIGAFFGGCIIAMSGFAFAWTYGERHSQLGASIFAFSIPAVLAFILVRGNATLACPVCLLLAVPTYFLLVPVIANNYKMGHIALSLVIGLVINTLGSIAGTLLGYWLRVDGKTWDH